MNGDDKKTRLGPGAAAVTPAAIAARAASALPVDPLLGQTLVDKYYVERKLGEGGMGAVYLCQHTLLEKPVALKVLHGEFARKPELIQRFMQEARAASKIRHDNVIDISDFGASPDGVVFFAMELLQGHDLHEEVARAKATGTTLPWERSLSILLQVSSALSAAHRLGIVHRDLKPENIYLVERGGRTDWVKLLDFGIAKLTELGEGERKLTRTGMLFGTPEYMAPEQARGEPVDQRVDIYAMGCILHQLVIGRVPFEADNFMGVLTMHLTAEPPQLSAAQLAASGAPAGVADVIRKSLAKDRAERYASIDEFAAALREVAGLPPESMPVSLPPSLPRITGYTPAVSTAAGTSASSARGRGVWVVAAVALAAVAAGAVLVPRLLRDTPASQPAESEPGAGTVPSTTPAQAPIGAQGAGSGAGDVAGGAAAAGAGAATTAGTAATTAGTQPAGGTGTAAGSAPSATVAMVALGFDVKPPAAEVVDAATKEVVGRGTFQLKTPQRQARRFVVRAKGYDAKEITVAAAADETVEVRLVKTKAGASGATTTSPTTPIDDLDDGPGPLKTIPK